MPRPAWWLVKVVLTQRTHTLEFFCHGASRANVGAQEIGQLSSKIVGPGGISKKMRATRPEKDGAWGTRAHVVLGPGLRPRAATCVHVQPRGFPCLLGIDSILQHTKPARTASASEILTMRLGRGTRGPPSSRQTTNNPPKFSGSLGGTDKYCSHLGDDKATARERARQAGARASARGTLA